MAEQTRQFTTSLVRWALGLRVVTVLVALVLPSAEAADPATVVAIALLGGWTLVWLAPRDGTIRVARRHPIVVVGDTVISVAVVSLVGVDHPLVLATFSTAVVIGLLFRTLLALLLLGVLTSGFLLPALAQAEGNALFAYAFVVPTTYVALALLGGVARRLHEQVLVEQARLSVATAEAAAAAERARLARDMHDSVAKSLHGVALAAAALPRWVERDQDVALNQAVVIQAAAEQASREARELLGSLRSRQRIPVAERLRDLVDGFRRRSGVEASLEIDAVPELDPGVAHELVQVVGEALENVHRHADAGRVAVMIRGQESGEVEVTVVDDGRGFAVHDVDHDRFGLVGMRERAEALGGNLDLDSAPGVGTEVVLRIPPRHGQPGATPPVVTTLPAQRRRSGANR